MARVKVTMEVDIRDDALSEFERITHHIDHFVDIDGWPEIAKISNVQVVKVEEDE